MAILKTKDLIRLLSEKDPEGELTIYFHIYDESGIEKYMLVAAGEITEDDIEFTKKGAYQTCEGDRDTLQIGLWLDCD